jgi:hypothetical protein
MSDVDDSKAATTVVIVIKSILSYNLEMLKCKVIKLKMK